MGRRLVCIEGVFLCPEGLPHWLYQRSHWPFQLQAIRQTGQKGQVRRGEKGLFHFRVSTWHSFKKL